jgi:hypothetical protein
MGRGGGRGDPGPFPHARVISREAATRPGSPGTGQSASGLTESGPWGQDWEFGHRELDGSPEGALREHRGTRWESPVGQGNESTQGSSSSFGAIGTFYVSPGS